MIRISVLLMTAALGVAAPVRAADLLPLQRGKYVDEAQSCDAAKQFIEYDGASMMGHLKRCLATAAPAGANRYKVSELCSEGAGANVHETVYQVTSPQTFSVNTEGKQVNYRLCAPPAQSELIRGWLP